MGQYLSPAKMGLPVKACILRNALDLQCQPVVKKNAASVP